MTSVEIDLRVGGTWRYVMIANDGFEVAFHGEYRELVPDERIVSTEVFEGIPDAEALDTLTLTEVDGRTTMEILVQHATKEGRDAHINSGMELGLQEALDLMEQVAVSLAGSVSVTTRTTTSSNPRTPPAPESSRTIRSSAEANSPRLSACSTSRWRRNP